MILDKKVVDRVAELVDTINKHRAAYYQSNTSLISDADYDKLMRELEGLESKYPELITGDSPTQTVGGEASQTFTPVEHLERMMSLDNVFSSEELDSWLEKTGGGPFLCELKIDGLAINLRYEKGKLVSAATRVFGRLTAWQNWIFQRPNAVGDRGALKVYGKGEKTAFDFNRV